MWLPSLEDRMVRATHTSLNIAATAVSSTCFYISYPPVCYQSVKYLVSGKCDDAGGTYIGPSAKDS